MATLMGVCAVFITVTPVANNFFKGKITKDIDSKLNQFNKYSTLFIVIGKREAIMMLKELKEIKDFIELVDREHKGKKKVEFDCCSVSDRLVFDFKVSEETIGKNYESVCFNHYKVDVVNNKIWRLNYLSGEYEQIK